ncbi:MAG: YceI family protein [Melioribacter sp.]|nr:YceI family protein [Melioribacter sp.]
MKKYILFVLLLLYKLISGQGFNVNTKGIQTFNFYDKEGRNQVVFFSNAPFEDITGTANDINGVVSFDVSNFAQTLRGKIIVKVESISTGIELRNQHLRSKNWLDAKKYPDIVFEIKYVRELKQLANNKLGFKVVGDFTLHGVTKEIVADVEATYLPESNETKKRAPGDLLGVNGKFNIKLSDFNIKNQVIGSKVAENIEIYVNIVGNNKH